MNIVKFLRTPFITEHLRWLLLNIFTGRLACWKNWKKRLFKKSGWKNWKKDIKFHVGVGAGETGNVKC